MLQPIAVRLDPWICLKVCVSMCLSVSVLYIYINDINSAKSTRDLRFVNAGMSVILRISATCAVYIVHYDMYK